MSDLRKTTFSSQISNKYVLWFETSNRWLLVEEPAYFVYKHILKEKHTLEIAEMCTERYGISKKEATRFTKEITKALLEHQTAPRDYPNFEPQNKGAAASPELQISSFYSINNKKIQILYSNSSIAYYLHPLLEKFEIENQVTTDIRFKVFKSNDKLVLLKESTNTESWTFENILKLKKQLFIEICGFIYEKQRKDWMTIIHGSAVNDGNEALVLAASSGSGKSTLAALLMNEGYQVMSDDFVPICGNTAKVFPFPVPISVKKVALPLLSKKFPGLEQNVYKFEEFATEYVNLLALNSQSNNQFEPYPVKHIVFPEYRPDSKLSLEQFDQDVAIQYFIDNAIILTRKENAARFIKWFKNISCYKLVYPDPIKAARKLKKLFSDKSLSL